VKKTGCPICGEAPMPRYRPFCSGRCADIDLQRWLDGDYVIPDGAGDSDGDSRRDATRA